MNKRDCKSKNRCKSFSLNTSKDYRKFISDKKSQVTIFVIIGILLVATIIGLILWRGEMIVDITDRDMPQPHSRIRSCTEESVYEAVDIMLPQGGYVEPSNYRLYENDKVEYLCYTQNYYEPCVNQEALYFNHLESEIHDYVKDDVEDCFDSLIEEYKDQNYDIDEEDLDLEIELRPGQILVDVDKIVEMTKGDTSARYSEDSYAINSPLYDLAAVAQEIVSQEANDCGFDYMSHSILYHSYQVRKDQVGGGETSSSIYKIKDTTTGKTLNVAIKSCIMPGGF